MAEAAKTGEQQRGGWRPGQSGNPRGRPRGSRHKATLAAEALLDGEAEGLTRKAVELALGGDTTALRLCLERILPPRKERPIQLELPPIESPRDAVTASAALLAAVSAGALAPGQANELARLLEVHLKALEVHDLDARLAALEAKTP